MECVISCNKKPVGNWYSRFEFNKGITHISQLPEDSGREVAFAGRSNAGKSSVINKMTGRRSLTKTSKKPGKTREINFFTLNEKFHLVDLPGYGFAKAGLDLKKSWSVLLHQYLSKRQSLQGVFLIIDSRRLLGEFDQQMLNYCYRYALPVHILLNKTDKLTKHHAQNAMMNIEDQLKSYKIEVQLFSVLKSIGVDKARVKLADWLFSN